MPREGLVAIILIPTIMTVIAIAYLVIRRNLSKGQPVIKKFMEAGVAKDVETAYACWSPQCATREEITQLIERTYELFGGYKRLAFSSMSTCGSAHYCAGGSIVYSGRRRLSFEARLVEENSVFGITSMQVGSTGMIDIVKSPSVSLGGPPGPGL
jgi:hypothetical protein